MSARAIEVRRQDGSLEGYFIECPGCQSEPNGTSGHVFAVREGGRGWTFNGNLERPTFSPSMLARHNYRDERRVCHSFVRDGRIQYLDDCTHALRGKTVDLPEVDRG